MGVEKVETNSSNHIFRIMKSFKQFTQAGSSNHANFFLVASDGLYYSLLQAYIQQSSFIIFVCWTHNLELPGNKHGHMLQSFLKERVIQHKFAFKSNKSLFVFWDLCVVDVYLTILTPINIIKIIFLISLLKICC